MLGKPGPFQIVESEGCGNVDAPIAAPRRRYECHHYTTCLDLAAALNWDSFTCRGCSSEIDQSLLWRARQAHKKDLVARSLCACPVIEARETDEAQTDSSALGPESAKADGVSAATNSAEAAPGRAQPETDRDDSHRMAAVVSLFGKST